MYKTQYTDHKIIYKIIKGVNPIAFFFPIHLLLIIISKRYNLYKLDKTRQESLQLKPKVRTFQAVEKEKKSTPLSVAFSVDSA